MASSAYYKFDCFAADLGLGIHNLDTDTLKIFLTNHQPVVGDTVYGGTGGDPAEIAAGNGYTATGAEVPTPTYAQTAGVGTLGSAEDVVFTAATGTMATFRWAVLYNATATAKNLICWWDYGSAVSLGIGESITLGWAADAILTLQKSA